MEVDYYIQIKSSDSSLYKTIKGLYIKFFALKNGFDKKILIGNYYQEKN